MYNLIYMAKPAYGGWGAFTVHLALKYGFPLYKKDDLLFDFADKEQDTLFGVSAKYIDALNNNGTIPKTGHDLSKLRTICSTGSPLSKDGFRYIYEKILYAR